MPAGCRTTLTQLGEMPAMLPIQPRTSVAVKIPIAIRGSKIHFQMEAIVSVQLSRVIRGVLAMMRLASQVGGSYTGNTLPALKTSDMPASSSVHAAQVGRCASIARRLSGLSEHSR